LTVSRLFDEVNKETGHFILQENSDQKHRNDLAGIFGLSERISPMLDVMWYNTILGLLRFKISSPRPT
jgi:hypothetical protein